LLGGKSNVTSLNFDVVSAFFYRSVIYTLFLTLSLILTLTLTGVSPQQESAREIVKKLVFMAFFL